MSQLTLFNDPTATGHEAKFSCHREPQSICIETYSTKSSKRKYYRLSIKKYGLHSKERHHIRGGSTISKLANYRKDVLQSMIDRGALLAEIIAQVTDWR